MTNHDSFASFARAFHDALPSEWDTNMDDLHLEQTDGTQVGYQRDDLYRWMLLMPHNQKQEWPPDHLVAYVPEEIDQIADRPGIPVREVRPVSVSAAVSLIRSHAPDYQGTFEYDE